MPRRKPIDCSRASAVHWYGAAAYALSSGAYVGDVELAPTIIQDLLTTQPSEPTGPYGFAVQITADILDSIGQHEASDMLMARALSMLTAGAGDPDVPLLRDLRANRDGDAPRSLARRGASRARRRDGPPRVGSARRSACSTSATASSGPRWAISSRRASSSSRACAAWARRRSSAAWCAIHMAWVDIVEGRYVEGAAWARKAFELDPHHAYAVAAFAHLKNGDQSEAERLVARALDGIEDGLVTPWVVGTAHAVAALRRARGRTPRRSRPPLRPSTPRAARRTRARSRSSPASNVLRALGRDASAEIAALVARIERHSASLPPELREGFRKLPVNARRRSRSFSDDA